VRLRRHPRVVAGVIAAVALAVVVGLLGGWARTRPDGVRAIQPGVQVDVTPFTVRLDSAEAVYELDGDLADEGLAYVVVDGEVSLDVNESVSGEVLEETFVADLTRTYSKFGSRQDVAEPQVFVADDGSSLGGIGPGLTYRVRLVYTLDEAAVQDDVTVSLLEHSKRPSFIDGVIGWLDMQPAARVSLVVAALPDERPVDEDLL
jgi:hypothetical protein